MPKSSRYQVTELPGTLQRSCREAQETFLRALHDAVRTHGAGDQAHRIAYLALKQKFEKRGDHWIAKEDGVSEFDDLEKKAEAYASSTRSRPTRGSTK